jgi:hypothetical protein
MTRWTAHCGCVIDCSDEDGQPLSHVRWCALHEAGGLTRAAQTEEDVASENRAMSIARKALEDVGVAPEDILTSVDGDDRHGHADGPNGEYADVPKLSHEEYLAQHEGAASYARRV